MPLTYCSIQDLWKRKSSLQFDFGFKMHNQSHFIVLAALKKAESAETLLNDSM